GQDRAAPDRAHGALADAEEPAALGADAALADVADPVNLAVLAVDDGQLTGLRDRIDHVARHPRRIDARQGQLPRRLARAHIHGADEAGMADRIDYAPADRGAPGDVADLGQGAGAAGARQDLGPQLLAVGGADGRDLAGR